MKATELGDRNMTEICKRIILIPKEVRLACLTQYLLACKWIYAIAFFQWRLNQSSITYHGKDAFELEELIKNYVKKRIIYKLPIDIETFEKNTMQKGDSKKYDLLDQSISQPFLINSFHRIGWQDPFPSEDNHIND